MGGENDAFVTKLNPTGSALVYSSFLGGSGFDQAEGLAVDASGYAYMTGRTSSGNFPTLSAFQPIFGGVSDAFVAKVNPAGSGLIYSSYPGGSDNENFFLPLPDSDIDVDAFGNAYVIGSTKSLDFPTTLGSFDTTLDGFTDAFVAKVGATGSLIYSTYLGGCCEDEANGVAVDASGNAYVTGRTPSTDFPTENPIQATLADAGLGDLFVTKLNADGSGLVFSSYLGGSGSDEAHAIALDASGNAYVTGFTLSADFPTTAGAFQQSTPEGCSSFPDGYIPFTQVYSTSAPNAAGDRLVVGQMSLEAFNTLQTISLPSTVNETFCGLVELAPGSFFGAYVPTAAERLGDFSSFGVPPIDPLTGLPFPGNIIPAFRLPDPYAWRIFTPSPRGDVFVAKIGPEFIEVTIDIKPGSDPNAINPADSGLTPVAILTTDTFDATTVSPITVQFGPAEASLEHQLGHLKDVDGDGDLDLVLHFPTQATGIQCGDSEASLSGETFGGQAIQGSDSVVTVGCT